MSASNESGPTTAKRPSSASAASATGRSRSKTSARTARTASSAPAPGSATLADPSVAAALWKWVAKQLWDRCMAQRARILDLRREEPRWIQVTERMPEHLAVVLVDGGPARYIEPSGAHNSGRWLALVESPHRYIQWEVKRWAPIAYPNGGGS